MDKVSMFSSIAPRYDLLNSILSLGLHKRWKRRAVSEAGLKVGDRALDLCSGTGDIAIYLAKKVGPKGRVVALDLSKEMLKLAQKKAVKWAVSEVIDFQTGDATQLDLANDSFHAVTIGFGIRNVDKIAKAFSEMYRVLRPGGKVICLEFSQPTSALIRRIYDFYSFQIIPRIGGLISKNFDAYHYLPDSIREFPDQDRLKSLMEKAGFKNTYFTNLAFGIVALHVGEK
ncbi:MAG: bifunctional demethylmenaquinone methyltransferase/2-methoxy-6-polyprenyl-1,4-benzoquinol methylase UbiE [Actinomycetota bacterium]